VSGPLAAINQASPLGEDTAPGAFCWKWAGRPPTGFTVPLVRSREWGALASPCHRKFFLRRRNGRTASLTLSIQPFSGSMDQYCP